MEIGSPTKKQLNVFVIGLVLILLFFLFKFFKAGNIYFVFFLLGIIWALVFLYYFKKNIVVRFYQLWMKAAGFLGAAITFVLMLVIFYFVFTPVGLFLRLFRKDILKLKRDPGAKTYWIDIEEKEFKKTDYERQF